MAQKEIMLFSDAYSFSQRCKSLLKKEYKGILISDLDFTSDIEMSKRNSLAYHLFPKVSLRYKKPIKNTCIIFLNKKEPEKALPDDYKILFSNENKDLILAVKKTDLDP